jgi:hypothetical protein
LAAARKGFAANACETLLRMFFAHAGKSTL